jgi:hypothetical protein
VNVNVKRSLGVFAAIAVGLALGGCSSCGKGDAPPPEASAPVASAEPPVESPEHVLAEVAVATPDATWKRLQTGIGGAAAILPNSFGGVACALAGLDPTAAKEIDGASPAYAVVAEGEGGSIAFALAMKLADAAHAQALLLDGETAAFKSKDVAGMRALVGKALPLQLAVAIARSGWMIVASSDADLARLAPYAYRTLPTRPAKGGIAVDVPRAALAGPVRSRAASGWSEMKAYLLQQDADQRAKHGGRGADYGDPPAIVACIDAAVQRRLAIVGDLAGAHVDLDASDDDVHLVATLTPADGDGPASQRFGAMHPGAAAPLLDAPADAIAAWLLRDDAAERASDARDLEQCVEGGFGKRVGDDDKKRLRALADEWAKQRGDWMMGTAMSSSSRGVVLRGPVADADAASRAVRDGTQLLARPFLAEPLKRMALVRDVASSKVDAPPLGKVDVVTLVRDEPNVPNRPKLPMAPIGFAWLGAGGELTLAIGESPASLLAVATKPKTKLGDDARVARAIGAIETNATFAFVAQRGARTEPAAGPPAVAAWGRRGRDGWARIEVGYGVLRDLLREYVAK